MHQFWIWFDGIGIAVVLAAIIAASLRPDWRPFVTGLALIAVGATGALLRELGIIPPAWWLLARILYLGLAITGLVLVERARATMRSVERDR